MTDGEHNPEYDHEVFLGGEEEARQYAELTPEQSKERLRYINWLGSCSYIYIQLFSAHSAQDQICAIMLCSQGLCTHFGHMQAIDDCFNFCISSVASFVFYGLHL